MSLVMTTGCGSDSFDPNAEVIFPGNLLNGASLGGATPTPISLDQSDGTITINLINGSKEVSQDVDIVEYNQVIQAMNEIIDANNGVLPARATSTSASP